jgi:hypothetical protein
VVVTLAVSVLLAVLGTLDAARDPEVDRLWGILSVGAAVLATVLAVLSRRRCGRKRTLVAT